MAVTDVSSHSLADLISLKGRNAVVTGGAQGLGKAIAKRLAEAGASVLIGDLKAEQAEAAAVELNALYVGKVMATRLDVTDSASIGAAGELAVNELGGVDIWVNNAGLYETALELATAGGSIILAGRNAEKGAQAAASITARVPAADVIFEDLDLARLQSVKSFAARLRGRNQPIDRLICNAGIMSPPKLERTADGHEAQFGVNYLSHFALTAGLLPLLRAAPGARVISVTSLAQNYAKLDLGNLNAEKKYSPGKAYCTSKLLQSMFAVELQRRSDEAGWGLTSVAAHPGFAGTNLFHAGGAVSPRVILPLVGQSAVGGAQSILLAATAPQIGGGLLYGPTGIMQMRGAPGLGKYPTLVQDEALRARVWALSEKLTGLSYR